MSEFLREFRERYPEYNDIGNDQLVSGLHRKYAAEKAPDITLEQFKSSIGYMGDVQPPAPAAVPAMQTREPQPLQQQPVPAMPQQKSMFDLVAEKMANYGAAAGERASDIGASVLGGIQTIAKPLDEAFDAGMIGFEEGSFVPKYFSAEEVKRRQVPSYLKQGEQALQDVDLGYVEDASWDDVKSSWQEQGISLDLALSAAEFGLEKGIQSIPDMAAVMASLPVYIVGRSQEIGTARAQNKGKEAIEPIDMLEAFPVAVGAATLERIGAKGVTDAFVKQSGESLLKAGFANVAARIAASGGKAMTKEAATEAMQEGMIEYAGERFGTDAKMSLSEALERGLAGAVAGGVFGGTAGTIGRGTRESMISRERAIRNKIAELEALARMSPDGGQFDAGFEGAARGENAFVDKPKQFTIDNTQEDPRQVQLAIEALKALLPSLDTANLGDAEAEALQKLDPNFYNSISASTQEQAPVQPEMGVDTGRFPIDQPPAQAPDVNVGFTPEVQQAEPEPEATPATPEEKPEAAKPQSIADTFEQFQRDTFERQTKQELTETINELERKRKKGQDQIDRGGAGDAPDSYVSRVVKPQVRDLEERIQLAQKVLDEKTRTEEPQKTEREKRKEQFVANTEFIEMVKKTRDRFEGMPLEKLQNQISVMQRTIEQDKAYVERDIDAEFPDRSSQEYAQAVTTKEKAIERLEFMQDQLKLAQEALSLRSGQAPASQVSATPIKTDKDYKVIDELMSTGLDNRFKDSKEAGDYWSDANRVYTGYVSMPFQVGKLWKGDGQPFEYFEGVISKEQYGRAVQDKAFAKELEQQLEFKVQGAKQALDRLYNFYKAMGKQETEKATAKPKPNEYSPNLHKAGWIQKLTREFKGASNDEVTQVLSERWKGDKTRAGQLEAFLTVREKAEQYLAEMPPEQGQETTDEMIQARIAKQYDTKTDAEVQQAIDELDTKAKAARSDKEFTGQGTRRTGAAVSNEAAREFARERDMLERYLKDRQKDTGKKGYSAATDYTQYQNAIQKQSLNADEIRQDYERLLASKEQVLAELNSRAYTKAMLIKIAMTPRTDAKKAQLAGMAYKEMLKAHILKDSFTIAIMGGKSMEEQFTELVRAQTQADVDAYYTTRSAKQAQAQEALDELRKALQNPETLAEFKTFIQYKGKDKLSQEQLAKYDELVADSLAESERAPVIRAQDKKLEYTRAEVTHAKKGTQLYVVSLKDRLSRPDYEELLGKAKELGGYYSTYNKQGAVAGFQFKTKAEADAFAEILDGRNVDASGLAEGRAEVIQSKNADKLTELADRIEEKAQEELSRDRKANTAKRAREAGYAIEYAESQLRFAMILRKVAAGLVDGRFKHLNNLSAATQLEELQNIKARYRPSYDRDRQDPPQLETFIGKVKIDRPYIFGRDVRDSLERIKGQKGYGELRKVLVQASKLKNDETMDVTTEQADLIVKARKAGILEKYAFWNVDDALKRVKRLDKLGITTDEQLRAALRELETVTADLKGQAKPAKEREIEKLERELVGVKIEGFFPTPIPLIDQMIEIADIQPNDKILEPSAGKGNIVDRLVSLVPDISDNIEVVERQNSLVKILQLKGYNTTSGDFLEHTGEYDKILMNPPFEKFQDIDHVRHAWDLLKPNGVLVAIMGAGVKNTRTKAREFREWLDLHGGVMQDNPEGSFKDADRATGVNTVMVTMVKPDSRVVAMQKADRKPEEKQSDSYGTAKTESIDRQVFNATGENHVGTWAALGLPPRYETIIIDGNVYEMPEKVQRHEPIKQKLVDIMGDRIYYGKIKGKSVLGFYRRNNGEIRTRKKNDVEVLAHEMAHYLDDYSNITLPNFQKLYKDEKYVEQVMALSYTDANPTLQKIEGFAEFVRLWLTNSHEAKTRAPEFYQAFNALLAKDKSLNIKMKDLQLMMHKFYLQGPDKHGQAFIGRDSYFDFDMGAWRNRRNSRIRGQMIDRFHAARRIEQDLTGRISSANRSAWKLLRIANGGAEGISDYIMNYRTVKYNAEGDLIDTGKGLREVLKPVKKIKKIKAHKNDTKLELLMRYFVGKRALELHSQGREKLIPYQSAKAWAEYAEIYPVFETIHAEYQKFNERNLDFYVSAGILSKESKAKFQEMNKNYVPFFRIREALEHGGEANIGQGFYRLTGGTGNLRDILVNIQDGIVSNTQSAMQNKAKQVLYSYVEENKDGAYYAAKIGPDTRPVKVLKEQMKAKLMQVFEQVGMDWERIFNPVDEIDMTSDAEPTREQEQAYSDNLMAEDDVLTDDLLMFWQVGLKPTLNKDGTALDTVMIGGKPRYYQVKDPMLQEMLLGMNPHSYGLFMKSAIAFKTAFTRTITLGAEFSGANFVRDTLSAAIISKGRFIPVASSLEGMYHYILKDKVFQEFLRSGAGYSSRLGSLTKEGGAQSRIRLKEFGVGTPFEKLISTIDNIASAFEYGTRIGEFAIAKRAGETYMEAGFRAREISTDFAVTGANQFLTGWVRTVPFLNAFIQSQDRLIREIAIYKKYDGNPWRVAMRGFLGVTIPSLLLWWLNKDDEEYKQIPDYEKRTNWHIKIPTGRFIKIPKPFDVGFVFGSIPELFMDYTEQKDGKRLAEGLVWTITQMYGIDGVPAFATGILDIYSNEKWTGAPVVPAGLEDVSPVNQYNANTSETFIRFGQIANISPIQAEHVFRSYTGYLGGYLLAGTDRMLWDEERFGERPDADFSDNIFIKRFITPEARNGTAQMERFYKLKEDADRFAADMMQQTRVTNLIKQRGNVSNLSDQELLFSDDLSAFGYTKEEKELLMILSTGGEKKGTKQDFSMAKISRLVFGERGIRTEELAIRIDKTLSGEEKRRRINELWRKKAKLFDDYMKSAEKGLKQAREEAEKRQTSAIKRN